MKQDVEKMDSEMDVLVSNMENIAAKSSIVNESLSGKRGKIDKLVRVRRLLKRLEIIFELPRQLSEQVEFAASLMRLAPSHNLHVFHIEHSW